MEQPASERANKTIQRGESSIHQIAKKQTTPFIISLVMNEKIKNANKLRTKTGRNFI
jgi:hypothetical protein